MGKREAAQMRSNEHKNANRATKETRDGAEKCNVVGVSWYRGEGAKTTVNLFVALSR